MPRNSIAVPLSPSARRGARLIAASVVEDDAEVSISSLPQRPTRPTAPHPMHRFRVGERLHMSNGGNIMARTGAACKVVFLMPYEGRGPLQYRVRSDAEAFERIVAEADLSRG